MGGGLTVLSNPEILNMSECAATQFYFDQFHSGRSFLWAYLWHSIWVSWQDEVENRKENRVASVQLFPHLLLFSSGGSVHSLHLWIYDRFAIVRWRNDRCVREATTCRGAVNNRMYQSYLVRLSWGKQSE